MWDVVGALCLQLFPKFWDSTRLIKLTAMYAILLAVVLFEWGRSAVF